MKQFYKYILLAVAALSCLGSITAQTYNGGTWYSLYDDSWTKVTATTKTSEKAVFAPTNETISINWKENQKSAGCDLYLDEKKIASSTIFQKHTSEQTTSHSVGKDISKVTVKFHCTLTGYFGKFRIPMAKHIRLTGSTYGTTSVSKDFGTIYWGQTTNQTVNFRSFLTNGNITVKLTSGDKNVWRLGTSDNKSGQITASRDGYTYAVGSNQFAYNGSGACSTGNKGKAI